MAREAHPPGYTEVSVLLSELSKNRESQPSMDRSRLFGIFPGFLAVLNQSALDSAYFTYRSCFKC